MFTGKLFTRQEKADVSAQVFPGSLEMNMVRVRLNNFFHKPKREQLK